MLGRPQVQPHIGAIRAIVLKQEGAGQEAHKISNRRSSASFCSYRKLLAGVTNELLLPHRLLLAEVNPGARH